MISNATNPSELGGAFGVVGEGVDVGPSLSNETAFGMSSCNKSIWTDQIAIGVGAAVPVDVHGGWSYTGVLSW